MTRLRPRGAWLYAPLALGFAAVLVATLTRLPAQAAPLAAEAVPNWIWLGKPTEKSQNIAFRKAIEVPASIKSARLYVTGDDSVLAYVDGKEVVANDSWNSPIVKDVTELLSGGGKHVLAARVKNSGGPGALLIKLVVEPASGPALTFVTDPSWKASAAPGRGLAWAAAGFDDAKWVAATVLGKLGDGPWLSVNAASLAKAAVHKDPVAPDPSSFKVAKGFKVERLYTVPKDTQGSWVNLTVDPKGRLITSDQYGKLYRVTPPPIGKTEAPKIEPINVALGEAQGLLWAFDSLYVVVNRGEKYASGLYRVIDSDGDDNLDKVEKLRELKGGGEHGPHGVVLSPDGKSLYVIAGNATALTELSSSLVPRIYDEDQILPYMPDGRGFMRDERAPGGVVYRVDPKGQDWELVSMGYRNPYDLAFNRYGDLFTYDSDMEWDVNTPWYRPTRVCQADSGSDLGYRNGSGKWPTYYPDSLPPTINIGPGSPTGVTFGYGAKFPAKYQEALYICDWSYGKLYAVHLTPDASHYKAELEEFVTGAPLPLTDLIVNPKDQALYFTIGGRRTLSGLYRVTYTGTESTEPSNPADPGAEARAIRRKLEAFHGKKDPKAVDVAWPYLGHSDRFIRFAARVAIEWQDVATWQERALTEGDPQAALTALLALVRAGDKSQQTPIFMALAKIGWGNLDQPKKLEFLRVAELAIARMGLPDEDGRAKIADYLESKFPAKSRELNAELSKLLVAVQSPKVAAKLVPMLETAPTQEEQIDYAASLRLLDAGWTPELRGAYFAWFPQAYNFKGGNSLSGFLDQIKAEAVKRLPDAEKIALKAIIEAKPAPKTAATVKARPFVKKWTVDELAAAVEGKLTKRDFDKGRALFAAGQCFNCHRYDNEGGTVGPDLTGVSGRFSPRDLLESIVIPSKTISDQYEAIVVETSEGQVITGRVVNLNGDSMSINTNMLDPSEQVSVNRRSIESIKPSPVSMMPEGLLDTFKTEEILDLLAYLLSRGDRTNRMFE